jgi:hypothetical protein
MRMRLSVIWCGVLFLAIGFLGWSLEANASSLARSAPMLVSHRSMPMSISHSRDRLERSFTRTSAIRPLTIGSSQPVTAEPPVPRPHETPCIVHLFSNIHFVDFSQHLWPYNPPAACPGPWEEVVFNANFNVTAGVQFDRTANVWINGANIYFGTTVEPSPSLSPSWHVERDVTDLTPVFEQPSTGQAVLGNIVNSTYTGIITGSAWLQFYPKEKGPSVDAGAFSHDVPDAVYPLSAGPLGGAVFLFNGSQQNATTLTLPQNVERAYLDVFLQSQIGDEFWYSCFPNPLATLLNNCGNTAFREGEVTIDGRPAGVAPVFPWIYTGGIDPFFWVPIPGVETLDFRPYRVDLTPFASLLSNGVPHTIALSVYNANNYFATTGNLLVFLDHGSKTVTGAVLADTTSAAPITAQYENVKIANGVAQGPLGITATHNVYADGYVNTSHGRVETSVQQAINFANNQQIKVTSSEFKQGIVQDTTISSTTRTATSGSQTHTFTLLQHKDWPLNLFYDFVVNPDGSATQVGSVAQAKHEDADWNGFFTHLVYLANAKDTLTITTSGNLVPLNPKTSQQYLFATSNGLCYNHTVTAFDNVQTGSFFAPCK